MKGEPWRRFGSHVDPDGVLEPTERARRAKMSYRAFLRSNARKAAKSRAAAKHRRDAALRHRRARGPSAKEVVAFEPERDAFIRFQIIWAAAQRGERGIADLARRQREVRSDCLLCRRPFGEPGAPWPSRIASSQCRHRLARASSSWCHTPSRSS